tara:strand:+ start:102 stop:344 length:243 start_codon:yes stop_codon:yes gene_type:complete
MKITKQQLKQFIKEELEQTLEEEQLDEGAMNMVMKVLRSPQAKEMLKNIILPMIQDALAEAPPERVAADHDPKPAIKQVR